MQPKRPRINPLIFALALAAVLMIWSVFTSGTGMSGGSTMSYSTVVHYFEHNQVTKFTLDRNTSVITLTLKEGDLDLPQAAAASTADSTGGLLSGMLSSSSADSTAAEKNSDGTVTVRYKLPYAYVFIENVQSYIDSYDAANPTAPMEYDYTSLKETIPWMEILFYLGMLGCTGFLLFSMMRGGGAGGGIMNVGKAKVKDERERPCWPVPVPVRPACRSTPSPARILWRCTSVSVLPVCETCLTRPRRPCPASSLLMRSMRWAVSVAPASAAATTSASRP